MRHFNPRSSGVKPRHRPVRTCVGCRERVDSTELVRIVAITKGSTSILTPDPSRSAAGRGAHLHPTIRCLELAERRKAFARALRLVGSCDASGVRAMIEATTARSITE